VHLTLVPLVIVAHQVQKAMQGQHADLGRQGVTVGGGLPPGDATGDGDVS
jgi:hypothetical protein